MAKINIRLSPAQVRKLVKGHSVQLSKSAVKGGEYTLDVHPVIYNRIMKARKQNKGLRLMLSEEEIAGSGLKEWLQGLYEGGKKAYDVAKKIYEPFKPILAPILRQGAQNLAEQGISKLASKSPNAASLVSQLSPSAIDLIGKKTGAFGMKSYKKPAYRVRGSGMTSMPTVRKSHCSCGGALSDNYNTLLAPAHPAMQSMGRVRLPDPGISSDLLPSPRSYSVKGDLSPIHPAMISKGRVRLSDPETTIRGGSFRTF